MKLLITFETIADAFSCEKIIKPLLKHSCGIIPEPRSLGVSCNYALQIQNISGEDVNAILGILKTNAVNYARIFHSITTPNGEIF
jgi:hypothetical protein